MTEQRKQPDNGVSQEEMNKLSKLEEVGRAPISMFAHDLEMRVSKGDLQYGEALTMAHGMLKGAVEVFGNVAMAGLDTEAKNDIMFLLQDAARGCSMTLMNVIKIHQERNDGEEQCSEDGDTTEDSDQALQEPRDQGGVRQGQQDLDVESNEDDNS